MGATTLAKADAAREADSLTVLEITRAGHGVSKDPLAPNHGKKHAAVAGTLENMRRSGHRHRARNRCKRRGGERRNGLGTRSNFSVATDDGERHNEQTQSQGVGPKTAEAHIGAGQSNIVSFVSTKSLIRMETEIATTLRVVASPTPCVPPRVMNP